MHLLEENDQNYDLGSESDNCIIVRGGTDDIPMRDQSFEEVGSTMFDISENENGTEYEFDRY